MFRIKKLNKDEKGQSMVEFALILPILLLIILGTIQFGIIFSSQIAVTNAAREGARVAAVGGSDSLILTRVQNSLGGHIFIDPISQSNISVTPATRTQADRGNEVTVTIENVKLDLFVPVPGIFAKNSEVALSGKASMRLEHLPGEDDDPPPDDPPPDDPPPPEIPAFNDKSKYKVGDKVKVGEAVYESIKDNNKPFAPPDAEYWKLLP